MLKLFKSFVFCIIILFNTSVFCLSVDFSYPTTTPTTIGSPNLSEPNESAVNPQITTDSSGRYVYAVWQRIDSLSDSIIQTAFSQDSGQTWQYPNYTPTSTGSPNLSQPNNNAFVPQIATDNSGRYVYAVWRRQDTSGFYFIQTAFSQDFGLNWQYPNQTPASTGSPNLSQPDKTANGPQITTDSSGRYIYAGWYRRDNSGKNIIQTALSQDFGLNWQYPDQTPTSTGSPNLSQPGQNAEQLQISSDSSGRYVYAVWHRQDTSGFFFIQTALSQDFGLNWQYPDQTPASTGSPNLSQPNKTAGDSHISSDSSGKYIYAVWYRQDNSGKEIIQTALSQDFGLTWQYPNQTPTSTGSPNLSEPGKDANESQIANDSSGRYVYAVWHRADTSDKEIIQTALSQDFGLTWQYPNQTPTSTGSPNLSEPGKDAVTPQIVTDSSGRSIYVVWSRTYNSGKNIIQTASGLKYFPSISLTINR